MASSIAASRLPALAAVTAAHALALAFLLELTRTRPSGPGAEETLTLVALLPAAPRESPRLPLAISPGAARGTISMACEARQRHDSARAPGSPSRPGGPSPRSLGGG